MGRVNIYLPDDLADAARSAELNISSLAQEAIRRELRSNGISQWLNSLTRLTSLPVSHADVIEAIDSARDEFGARSV